MKLTFVIAAYSLCRPSIALRGSSFASGSLASKSAIEELVSSLISNEGEGKMRFSHVIQEVSKEMDLATAASSLQQKHVLPKEVSSLLMRASINTSHTLEEVSLTKARKFLNGLVEAAQIELDDAIIEAKEFEARNRGTWRQVSADIARLSEQIAQAMKRASKAYSCVMLKDRQLIALNYKREAAQAEYMRQYKLHFADLQIKQNDLDVFDFLIKTTKQICDEQAKQSLLVQAGQQAMMQICDTADGAVLRFSDVWK
jgi:hypothetical protein